ncbi:MAG: hypothetical protein ACHQ1H_15010, partial [Nitrososphaerales archaeon]
LGSGSIATGTFDSQKNVTETYAQQYLVSITSLVVGGSSSSRGGWYNASSNVILTETNDSGWGYGGWSGSGSGAYTGSNDTYTLNVAGPIIEQPVFLPALTLAASSGGSMSYSYGSSSGQVNQGETTTLYLPSGTQVSLTTTPASFLNAFQQWSDNSSDSSSTLNMKVLSPSHLEAQFGYNFENIALIGGIPMVAIVLAMVLLHFRKHGAKE